MTSELLHSNRDGKLERTTPDKIYGFFWATVDFETEVILGTMSFGDKEFHIDAVATPKGRPNRYALWEWADACNRPELVPRDSGWVTQPDRVRTIVRETVRAFGALESVIADAARPVLDRIGAARLERQAAHDAELRKAERARTVSLADEAFAARDWLSVVTLLESVKSQLTPAEDAKLSYARRRSR
jgi:hypothetical protein